MSLPGVARRVGSLLLSLLIASVLIFLATNALPGDIAAVILGTNANPEAVDALRERLGLNRALPVRYVEWILGVFTGDFGTSMITGRAVLPQIIDRLAVTAWLIGFGMLLAIAIAVPLGSYAAVHRRRTRGFIASVVSQIGLSVPSFWAGLWLVIIFAVTLRWLPAGGYEPLTRDPAAWATHLVLPVLALALVQGSVLARYVRSTVIEVMNEDYFRTARAMGWSRGGALWRHGKRNIAISLLTVLGLQLSTLVVGVILIEQVFTIPGLGSRLLQAVTQRDLVLVQGIVLLLVWLVLVINFLIDLAYQLVDPRLKETAL